MLIAEIIVGALILILSIVIIAVVLLQQGRRAGITGAISGGPLDQVHRHRFLRAGYRGQYYRFEPAIGSRGILQRY